MMIEKHPFVKDLIKLALREDIGPKDITTDSIVDPKDIGNAKIIAKEDLILAGISLFKEILLELSQEMEFKQYYKDGDYIKSGNIICELKGPLHSILKGERTALNFLQRMSGIATITKKFVEKVYGTGVKIVDTRKTIPGWRILDKYAVRMGGGYNHRFGLFDGILIKDNHIKAIGSIRKAINMAKKKTHHLLKIEVEVENIEELVEAIDSGADIVLLDNMNINMIKEAVRIAKGKIMLEASGGVSLENVEEIAKTGVNFISVGSITHSAKGVDISLELIRKGH